VLRRIALVVNAVYGVVAIGAGFFQGTLAASHADVSGLLVALLFGLTPAVSIVALSLRPDSRAALPFRVMAAAANWVLALLFGFVMILLPFIMDLDELLADKAGTLAGAVALLLAIAIPILTLLALRRHYSVLRVA